MSSKKPIAIAAILSLVLIGALIGIALVILQGDPSSETDPSGTPVSRGDPRTGLGPDAPEGGPEALTPANPALRDRTALTVRVVDEDTRTPIRGSQVFVNKAEGDLRLGEQVYPPPSRGRQGLSRGGSGIFKIDLLPGTYRVMGQVMGYRSATRQVQVLEGAPQTVELSLGRGLTISGFVYDHNRRPIAGAVVRAYTKIGEPDDDLIERMIGLIDIEEKSQEKPKEAISNADGSYQIDGLEPEYYDVTALAAGQSPAVQAWIRPSRSGVNFALHEGSTFSGTVVDFAGQPIEGARVGVFVEIDTNDIVKVVEAKARPPLELVETGSDGRFEIRTVGAGTYNVQVMAAGFQPHNSYKERITPGENSPRTYTLRPGLVISGEVIDEEGQPILGARVRPMRKPVAGERSQPISISFDDGRVETGEGGEFTFASLIPGTYNLLVWHDDYASQQVRNVSVGTTTLRVKLDRGGAISGRVLQAGDGAPVAGARVLVTDLMDVKKEGIAGADGYYVVSGLNPKRSKSYVTVQAEGYARLSNQTVQIRKNEELKDTDWILDPVATVVGRVVDAAGNAVSNTRVTARRPAPKTGYPVPVGSAVTDEEGRYAIDLEAGDQTTITAGTSEYLETESDVFAITSGGRQEVPDIVLALGGKISGTVVDDAGQPITGALLSIREDGETEFSYTKTASSDARGRFTINGLNAGTLDLQGKHPRFLEAIQEGLSVREGLITADVRLVLRRGKRLEGKIIDDAGGPVQGATVVVREFVEGVKEHRQQSDAQGIFLFESLTSTEPVELEITHQSFSSYNNQSVPVAGDPVEIQLDRLGSVSGTVIGATGEPLVNFSVKPKYTGEGGLGAPPPSRLISRTFNQRSGEFTYEALFAGTYEFAISAPGYAALVVPDVAVKTGEMVQLGELILPEGGLVDGIVVDDATGQPLAGAQLRLGGLARRSVSGASGGAATTEKITGGDGRFTFRGLQDASKLSIRVELEGYVSQTLTSINTRDASTCRNIRIALEIGGEITGIVTDPDGNPKGNVSVYLGGLEGLRGQTGVNKTTRSAADGTFRFEGLRAGNYRLSARTRSVRNSAGPQSLEVQVISGNALDVQLVVE